MEMDRLKYNFYIQTGRPTGNKNAAFTIRGLGDAIFDAFRSDTEKACIVWDRIYVPMSYRNDLSVIIDEILFILENLHDTESGDFQNYFSSNTFHCNWHFRWTGDDLRIEASWDALSGQLHKHNVLSTEINVSRICFIGEWLELLRVVRDGVLYCGFDASVTEPLNALLAECDGKYPRGLLYQDLPEHSQPS